jgi:hypothetical protein
MATLTSLSPELLIPIIEHLDNDSRLALLFTNKTFAPFINPGLYHTTSHSLSDTAYPTKWFRTLNSRPDLAVLVKRVQFRRELSFIACTFDIALQESPRPREVIQLPKLPQLQVLAIEYSSLSTWTFKVGNGGRWSEFGNLKQIIFRNEEDYLAMGYTPNFEMLFPVFHVSSLESIEIVLPEPVTPEELHWTENLSQYSLPNLGALHLLNSQASSKTLSKILAITPNLHTLEYNFVQNLDKVRRHSDHNEVHNEEWGDLTTALLQVKGSLIHLAISVSYFYLESEDYTVDWTIGLAGLWQRRGWMGSLQSMTKLERLEIPLPVLLGWNPDPSRKLRDVLPNNLRELRLRDDLVDWWFEGETTYSWTPWETRFSGDPDSHFRETVDCSPVIEQLRDYLIPSTRLHSTIEPLALERLSFEQIQGRIWPKSFVTKVGELCREADIEGVFFGQLTNEGYTMIELTVHDPCWTDELLETASSSPEFAEFQYRYVHARRKALLVRYCRTTPDATLMEIGGMPWSQKPMEIPNFYQIRLYV